MPGPMSPTEAARSYGVNVEQGMEVIYQPIYDFKDYPDTGQKVFTFFQQTIGGGATPTTIRDTNVEGAGQFPSPQRFLVQAVEVHYYSSTDPYTSGIDFSDAAAGANAGAGDQANDVYRVLKEGSLVLRIGSKDYVTQAPLVVMPASNKFVAQFAVASGNAVVVAETDVGGYMAPAGPSYNLQAHKVPLWIPPNQNFNVKIEFDTEIPVNRNLKAEFVDTSRIGVRLCGLLYRSRQ